MRGQNALQHQVINERTKKNFTSVARIPTALYSSRITGAHGFFFRKAFVCLKYCASVDHINKKTPVAVYFNYNIQHMCVASIVGGGAIRAHLELWARL